MSAFDSEALLSSYEEMSPTQQRVFRFIMRRGNYHGQIAGHGRAPWLSAAHALIRKGFFVSFRTGEFVLTEQGRALSVALMEGAKR